MKQRTLRVAICIPCYSDPKFKFMHSLVNMVVYSLSHANLMIKGEPTLLELETFMVSCSMLTESRHRLLAEAINWDADYMLCLDADHIFPHDTLMRLLTHNLPVVGCNYSRRVTPTAPTAAGDSDDEDSPRHLIYTTQEKADAGEIEECAHLGFGVLLINMKVFDALQRHAEDHGDGNFLPLFKFEPTENKVGMIGEDVFFFKKLAEAGIRPFIDHALSWNVGHCFEIVLTNAHACVQKDAWGEKRQAEKQKREDKIKALEQGTEAELVNNGV